MAVTYVPTWDSYYTSTSSTTPTWYTNQTITTSCTTATTNWVLLQPTVYNDNTAWLTWQNNARSAPQWRPSYTPTVTRRIPHTGASRPHPSRKRQAEHRSKRLLLCHLTSEQRAEFRAKKSFTVVGVSGYRYEIREGWTGNVYRLDEKGKRMYSYCCHVSTKLPVYDNLLTQKLALEHDENQFIRLANRTAVA